MIVVGGGPAGGLAAHELARAGLATLLVERARMPRAKVCGGCLDAEAVEVLRACGLGGLPVRAGAAALHAAEIRAGGRRATLPLHGLAIRRARLDAALLDAARAAGARVLTGVEARTEEHAGDADARTLRLVGGGRERRVHARLVLAADGLSGRLLGGRPAPAAPRARVGAGLVLPDAGGLVPPGVVTLGCGTAGYVGLVRVDAGGLSVAAALDAAAVRAAGGPSRCAAAILREAGLAPPPGLLAAPWSGTPPLTRRATRLGARRMLGLGDAAGFVEPFTGQGMGWALLAARAVVPLALEAVARWHDGLVDAWTGTWTTTVARRQRACRGAAWLLRHPALLRLAVGGVAARPAAARSLVARLLPGSA